MIINMNNRSGPVQVVDFTLSQDTLVNSINVTGPNVLTVDNVFLPGDTIYGFVIRPLDVVSNYVNSVSQIYTDLYEDGNAVTTRLRYVAFVPSGTTFEYKCEYNPNDNAYAYDATAKRLTVGLAGSYAMMKAGNYRLMIW